MGVGPGWGAGIAGGFGLPVLIPGGWSINFGFAPYATLVNPSGAGPLGLALIPNWGPKGLLPHFSGTATYPNSIPNGLVMSVATYGGVDETHPNTNTSTGGGQTTSAPTPWQTPERLRGVHGLGRFKLRVGTNRNPDGTITAQFSISELDSSGREIHVGDKIIRLNPENLIALFERILNVVNSMSEVGEFDKAFQQLDEAPKAAAAAASRTIEDPVGSTIEGAAKQIADGLGTLYIIDNGTEDWDGLDSLITGGVRENAMAEIQDGLNTLMGLALLGDAGEVAEPPSSDISPEIPTTDFDGLDPFKDPMQETAPSEGPSKPTETPNETTSPKANEKNDSCFLAGTLVQAGNGIMRSIESIRIGQRVAAFADDRVGPSMNPEQYRVIHLQFVDDGREVLISYLRPAEVAESLSPGDTIQIELMEVEARGKARVLGIEPCPELEAGPGQIVTAVLSSDGLDLKWLKLAGLDEPIGITSNHPIYSEDRMAFVPLSQTHEGERVRTRSGSTTIESIKPMFGRHRVYNMEIGSVHQYYVSNALLLVHNENSGNTGNGGTNDQPRKTKQGGARTEPNLPPKTIVKDGGVEIKHYTRSGDHGPAHLHVEGEGPSTKIGMNGKPIEGSPELSATQRGVVDENKGIIRKAVDQIQRWFNFNNL